MNSGPRQRAAGKAGFTPCLDFAEGARRSWLFLPWVFRAGLILIALWAAAAASNSGFAAENKNNTPSGEDNPPAGAVIRDSSIHASQIQMNVDRVIVPITVTDHFGRIFTNLEKEHFEVFDNKVRQEILSFGIEDAPLAVGIIFDTSGSMADKIQKSKEAAIQFFKSSNPEDQFMLVSFSSKPYLISDFTGSYENLLDQILFAKSGGTTSLLDALYIGLARLKQIDASRKALLVISDGADNHSRYTFWDLRKIIKEANVQIYTIGVFEPVGNRWRTFEEATGPSLLLELAEMTGGKAYSAESPEDLPDITEAISIILRNQYVIGYKPSNLVRDGRWRRIQVKLHPPRGLGGLQVYTRAGYYAPTQ